MSNAIEARPLSVSVISWLGIVPNIFFFILGLVYSGIYLYSNGFAVLNHPSQELSWELITLLLSSAISLVVFLFLLKGKDWARWLVVFLVPLNIILSLSPAMAMLSSVALRLCAMVSLVIISYAILIGTLFHKRANAYFRQYLATAKEKMRPLGVSFVGWSIIFGSAYTLILLICGIIGYMVSSIKTTHYDLVAVVLVTAIMLVSAFNIIVGRYLLKGKNWTRWYILIIAVLGFLWNTVGVLIDYSFSGLHDLNLIVLSVMLVILAAEVLIIWLLFRKPATAFFKFKPAAQNELSASSL